jgi:transposase
MTRSTVDNGENANQFAAFVGLDWADKKHDVCLSVGDSKRVEYAVVQQTPEAIDDWVCRLRQRFDGRSVAVCIEQTRGAVVHALMKYEFITIFPLPPGRLAKYRESFTSSGAKDDPSDANLIWDYLARHPDRLTAWKPDDALTREIGLLAEARRDAVNLRTQLANQLIATLKGYFPQALSLVGDSVHTPMACAFLSKWTTSDQLAKARPQTVREFYYAHNCRSERRIEERFQTIAGLSALTTDTAIINSSVMKVRMLVAQLRPLTKSIEKYDRQIEQLFARHPDAELYTCLPGAGDALAPRLLAALGNDRDRFASAAAIQCLSGIAPVTKRSGKRCSVQRRWACAKFLRQSFQEFAHHSRHHSPWAKAFYQSQRAHGKAHHTAVRALAFKWIRILYRCWKTKTPYNETVYLEALRRRNSPLLKYLDQPLAPRA